MSLQKSDKIFVAGHNGLVGSAIIEILRRRGYNNILAKPRSELNLLDSHMVDRFYAESRPDVVFVAAARVGGIHANNTFRADFIWENLQIQNNLIWGAHKANVRRLIFLGSSCIYPRDANQPMSEASLLTGPLEYTNRPYAVAKIAGLELVNGIRMQYGRDYFSVMPTNLYGPRDNFHPENSHVLPALIRKFQEAKQNNKQNVVIWGSGLPRREFMFSLDCADAIVHLAENLSFDDIDSTAQARSGFFHFNIGTGSDITIKELATLIGKIAGFSGEIVFDTSKPDGAPRKLLNIEILEKTGWSFKYTLDQGINETLSWFQRNFENID